MTTMFIRHTVDKAWRKVYDDFAPVQKAKGVTAQAVYQAADNPNDITVTHDFATLEACGMLCADIRQKNTSCREGPGRPRCHRIDCA